MRARTIVAGVAVAAAFGLAAAGCGSSGAGSSSLGGAASIAPSKIPVVHDAVGGQLIISTSQQGIADFRSAGPRLSSDPNFTAALKASSMPGQTTGFLYANFASAVPLVQALGPLLGLKLPAGIATADLGALKTLTAYGTRVGEESTFTVFLEVR